MGWVGERDEWWMLGWGSGEIGWEDGVSEALAEQDRRK